MKEVRMGEERKNREERLKECKELKKNGGMLEEDMGEERDNVRQEGKKREVRWEQVRKKASK